MLNRMSWIVVPGGPGLSITYLSKSLTKAFSNSSLLYLKLLGSPESGRKSPKLSELVQQIEDIASENNLKEYGLITHSFGNYLGLRALKNATPPKAIIMLSPMPFTYGNWKKALNDIAGKVPSDVMTKVASLSSQADKGTELFKLIYPYYVADVKQNLPFDVAFDNKACDEISGQVTEFDDTGIIETIDIPIVRLVGELDPFYIEKRIISDRTVVLPKVGHYPFFEEPQIFMESIRRVEEILCQQAMKTKKKFC